MPEKRERGRQQRLIGLVWRVVGVLPTDRNAKESQAIVLEENPNKLFGTDSIRHLLHGMISSMMKCINQPLIDRPTSLLQFNEIKSEQVSLKLPLQILPHGCDIVSSLR